MNIIPVSQGLFTVGHDKIFRPFDPDHDEITERTTGSLLVEVQPFIVVTENDVLLFDCGLHHNDGSGRPYLAQALSEAGFNMNDITKVFFSHLHKDHSGGAVYHDLSGQLQLSFPDIPHFIYKNEMDYALLKGSPSYDEEVIEFIQKRADVQWLTGNNGKVGSVHFEHSGGHSPEHIVYKIEEGRKVAFYGGDEAPQLKQMKMKYVAKYDFDGKKAMALREHYAEQGKKAGWEFLFYHDIKNPLAQLT